MSVECLFQCFGAATEKKSWTALSGLTVEGCFEELRDQEVLGAETFGKKDETAF